MLFYKVKTHTYFHQEKKTKSFAYAFQDSINITHLPLCTQTGHRPRKIQEHVHMDELITFASIVQGFFEKQL